MKELRDAMAKTAAVVVVTLVIYVALSGPLGGLSTYLVQRSYGSPPSTQIAEKLYRAHYTIYRPLMWLTGTTGTAAPLLWYWSLFDHGSCQSVSCTFLARVHRST